MAYSDLHNKKILFAPHEIGNQMQLIVDELRRRGYYATSASYTQEWYGYVNDINLNLQNSSNKFKKNTNALLFTLWAANNFDIFHFFWGESLFGINGFPHLDLPLLKSLGKKIFVHFRGLDLIDLKHFDYLRAKTAGDVMFEPPISRPGQLTSLRKWRKYADKLLVSEPDLMRVTPEAVLVQQALRLDEWVPSNNKGSLDKTIRIAHAPTLRRKKGTEFIVDAVQRLKDEGLPVELILIENIPANQVKPLYESCDIIVDQVLYGWYGKVSIEAMALGKPAVCYIDPQWQPYRPDCPIVNAKPENLKENLQRLVENEELRHKLGETGMAYAKKYHDIKSITDQCLEIYTEAYKTV
jgi:glycosyltransferase involved in cell wall biosynthesis